jgi:hypothetical protein
VSRGQGGSLPVDPDRLRRQFPELDDDDLAAYAEVTQRILTDQTSRARTTREVMERARVAEGKQAAGQPLTAEEDLALRYRRAVGKMQRSTAPRP